MKVLCSVGYYLPGYQFGGPVRTIANMVDHLGEEFDFRIVTKDRDALDTEPYAGVEIDAWNQVGAAQVFYASPAYQTLRGWRKILGETEYDILYLNSFFSDRFTILPLLLRRLRLIPSRPTIVAPRGEFSLGALELKASKKRVFLRLAKATGLYRGLTWQASSDFEKEDIRRAMGTVALSIVVAPNLAPRMEAGVPDEVGVPSRNPGPLRIVFLSRISPKKNLGYLLQLLPKVNALVEVCIYGIQDDRRYWNQIESLIASSPPHIPVHYHGRVLPEEVSSVFAQHDLFVFPTLGENFGHVILESLMAGTPVLLSDRTLWKDSGDGGLQVLPLAQRERWIASISEWAFLDNKALFQRRAAAYKYASRYLACSDSLEINRRLFVDSLKR